MVVREPKDFFSKLPGEVPDDRGNEVPEDEGQWCVDLAV